MRFNQALLSVLLFGSSLFGSVPLRAVTLAPVPPPPRGTLPINVQQPAIECGQIIDRMNAFRDMSRSHEDGLTAFVGEVAQRVSDWHAVLSPLEGTNKVIPAGTFEPLREGGERMYLVVDYAYENSALLASELDRIIVALTKCSALPQKR